MKWLIICDVNQICIRCRDHDVIISPRCVLSFYTNYLHLWLKSLKCRCVKVDVLLPLNHRLPYIKSISLIINALVNLQLTHAVAHVINLLTHAQQHTDANTQTQTHRHSPLKVCISPQSSTAERRKRVRSSHVVLGWLFNPDDDDDD